MKRSGKIVLAIAVALSTAVIVCGALFCWYVPRYISDKTTYDVSQKADEATFITVMSYNIRCIAPEDLFRKSWFYRAKLVLQTIAQEQPDILGLQEVSPLHEHYLRKHLIGYTFLVAYRSQSGIQEGMMLAYRTDRFDAIDSGMFWISETPEMESKDWGSAFPRVAVYATLQDKRTAQRFTVLDTHLDHISEEARGEGMRVLCEQKQARGWQNTLLMGDMNDYDTSLQYTYATSHGFADAAEEAQLCYHGKGATYQGYGQRLDAKRIDYIYCTPLWQVADYHVADTTFDGVYASDHFAIVAIVSLSNPT